MTINKFLYFFLTIFASCAEQTIPSQPDCLINPACFNTNCSTDFVCPISLSDFFDEDKKYFGVHHPCHFVGFPPHNQKPGAYDTNPLSNACINDSIMDMKIYYQGCLWGGQIPQVFDMMEKIDEWTKEDVPKNAVGKYYEESYLNKWFLTHREDVNTLNPDYEYPEMFKEYCNFPNKMMHLSKDNKSLDNNQW